MLASSSPMICSTSPTVTCWPSARITSLCSHCHTWDREISAVAASSIRLKIATAPVPASQLARYCRPTLMLLRSPASVTPGGITEAGLRNNISVGLQYLANWLAGTGAVAIFNLMEDAATAEISRSQVWQWLHNDVSLAEGQQVTAGLVEQIITEELAGIREQYGAAFDPAQFDQAVALFKEVALADDYAEFLTIPAYERMP